MSFHLTAQVQIRGELRDAQSGEAIPFALIYLHETGQQSSSEEDGNFQLSVKPGNYHLHIEVSGYQAKDYHLKVLSDTLLRCSLTPTYLELQEMLVEESFSKTQQRKSSLAIEKINLEEGEGARAASLAEVLVKLPGLNAYNTGVGIAKPVIRGFTGSRVAVLDQGIKQEGQQWGMDHGLEIDPFNVQSVEIIKGPGALQYGSDASGGVMKLLPTPFPREGWSGDYSGIYKSNNRSLGNSLHTAYRRKNQFISARLSYQQYQDFRVPAEQFTYNGYILPVVDNTLKNTAGKLLSGRLNYGWLMPGFNMRLMVSHYRQQVGMYPGAIGIPRAYDVGNIGLRSDIGLPHQDISHSKVYAKLNFKVGNNWLVTDLGYQQNLRRENSRPHAHGFQEIAEDDTRALGLDLHTYTLNSHYSFPLGKLKFNLGTNQQLQQNTRSGWEYLLPGFQRYNGGVFAMAEGEFSGKWNWNGGLRGDYALLHSAQHLQPWYNDPDSLLERSPALRRHFANYALAFGITYNPDEAWNFKLNLARSFRLPVPAELVSNGIHHGTFRHEVGNPTLNSELGYQFDLGLSYTRRELYLKLSPFFNYFDNFLYLRPTASFSPLPDAGQLYRYSQARALHSGAEFYAEYHPVKPLHLATALEYVLAYNLESGLPLPFTPPLSNLFTAEYHGKINRQQHWSINSEYRLSAAQNRTDRNEKSTPAYQLWNMGLGYHHHFSKVQVRINLGVNNLLNTPYLQHLSRYRILNLPEQGRNIIVSLHLKF